MEFRSRMGAKDVRGCAPAAPDRIHRKKRADGNKVDRISDARFKGTSDSFHRPRS